MMLCYVAMHCVDEYVSVAWRARAANVYFRIVSRLLTNNALLMLIIMLYSDHHVHLSI